MAVSSRALVDLVLLGPTHDRRQLQDSPILGDVWLAFANKPAQPQDLLMSAYRTRPAGPVAALVSERVQTLRSGRRPAWARAHSRASGDDAPHVAYLQGLVAARLYFREVLELIVPMTGWWNSRKKQLSAYGAEAGMRDLLEERITAIVRW